MKTEGSSRLRDEGSETPSTYSYRVSVRRVNTDLWAWQVDLEEGNGVLDWGFASRRHRAVRRLTRAMRRHARRRGDKPDGWWMKTE